MAQKVEVVLTCDLDAGDKDAVATVTFAVEGQGYEFELCQAHLDEFRTSFQTYVAAARRSGSGSRRGGGRSARPRNGGSADLALVRDWARNNGYEVSDRGRIPAQIREAFDSAQR